MVNKNYTNETKLSFLSITKNFTDIKTQVTKSNCIYLFSQYLLGVVKNLNKFFLLESL